MKLIPALFLALLVSCSTAVYLEPGTPEAGVAIWGREYTLTDDPLSAAVAIVCNGKEYVTGDAGGRYVEMLGADLIILSEPNRTNVFMIAHEMGHFYGYGHSDDIESIMYYKVNQAGFTNLRQFKEFR